MAKAMQRADYGLRAARAPLAARARSLQPFGRHRVTPVAVRPVAAQSKLLPEVQTDPPGTTRYAAEPHDTCFDHNDSSTGRAYAALRMLAHCSLVVADTGSSSAYAPSFLPNSGNDNQPPAVFLQPWARSRPRSLASRRARKEADVLANLEVLLGHVPPGKALVLPRSLPPLPPACNTKKRAASSSARRVRVRAAQQ